MILAQAVLQPDKRLKKSNAFERRLETKSRQ